MPAPSVALTFDSALGGGTASTATGPATVAEGDLLILFVLADDTQTALTGSTTGSPAWPSGWTEIQAGINRSAGGDVSGHAAWKIAGAGDVASGTGVAYSLTWTVAASGSATFIRVPAGEFDTTTPLGPSSLAVTGSGATSIALPGITTTVADTRLVAFYGVDESSAYVDYWSSPGISGWTNLLGGSAGQGGSNTYAGSATAVQTTAGATGDKVATITSENDAIIGLLVSIRPAAGAGGVTATLAETAPSPVESASVALAVSASGNDVAPSPTESASASVSASASLTETAPEPVETTSAALVVEATASESAPAPVEAASGSVGSSVSASAAEMAPEPTESVSSTVLADAALAETAPAPAESASGSVGSGVAGTLAEQAPAPVESAATALALEAVLVESAPAPVESAAAYVGTAVLGPLAEVAPSPVESASASLTLEAASAEVAPDPIDALIAEILAPAPSGSLAEVAPPPVEAVVLAVPEARPPSVRSDETVFVRDPNGSLVAWADVEDLTPSVVYTVPARAGRPDYERAAAYVPVEGGKKPIPWI